MRLYFLPLSFLLVIAATCTIAYASSGDRSDTFRRCVGKCVKQSCTATDDDGSGSRTTRPVHHAQQPLPLALRLTRWSCADNCKYACMHMLTDFALESGVQMEQYYGKWPFWRFAGMQEPASVVFSFANLLMHVLGLDWLRRGVHPAHPMKPFYLTWAYLSINAWVWSAVFHTRGAYSLPLPLPLSFHSFPSAPYFPFHAGNNPFYILPSIHSHLMHKKRVFE
jgi:post-GPI attachment to proteins factor 3